MEVTIPNGPLDMISRTYKGIPIGVIPNNMSLTGIKYLDGGNIEQHVSGFVRHGGMDIVSQERPAHIHLISVIEENDGEYATLDTVIEEGSCKYLSGDRILTIDGSPVGREGKTTSQWEYYLGLLKKGSQDDSALRTTELSHPIGKSGGITESEVTGPLPLLPGSTKRPHSAPALLDSRVVDYKDEASLIHARKHSLRGYPEYTCKKLQEGHHKCVREVGNFQNKFHTMEECLESGCERDSTMRVNQVGTGKRASTRRKRPTKTKKKSKKTTKTKKKSKKTTKTKKKSKRSKRSKR